MNVELTRREREVLNTNLSAEIMKLHYRYLREDGEQGIPERLQVLYSLRDKLCHQAPNEEKENTHENNFSK